MNIAQKTFAKIREVTQQLLTKGPAAAIASIRQALQGNRPDQAAATPAQPQRRRDNKDKPPVKAKPNVTTKAKPRVKAKAKVEARVEPPAEAGKDFVPELLARLRLPEIGDLKFNPTAFAPPSFVPSSLAPQPAAETGLDALIDTDGKFIASSYSNDAGSRAYKLYVPTGYRGQPLPLVVMLHGCSQDPDDFAAGTRMNAIAEEMHCLVLYPAQAQVANSTRCWNWYSTADQQRDRGEPAIIAGMTRQIIGSHHVDPQQVYIAGLSAGGAMAVIMGALYPELYAAIGVHSGLPYGAAHDMLSAFAAMKGGISGRPERQARAASAPMNMVPVIVFHGDRDTTVHPHNGLQVMAQGLPEQDADDADSTVKVAPQVLRATIPNGHSYTKTTHHNAGGHGIAEHWLIHGAGHAWSGGSHHGSYTDAKGPDASREMLRFFYSHRRIR